MITQCATLWLKVASRVNNTKIQFQETDENKWSHSKSLCPFRHSKMY